jgi:hypothetical protein
MKKIFWGLMVLIGFVFIGCDNGTTSNSGGVEPTQFEGTWVNAANAEYVFTNNNWRLVRPGREDDFGTFTFTEDPAEIRFITIGGGGTGGFRCTYEFDNNGILNFTAITGSSGPASSTGNFTKQTEKFEGTWISNDGVKYVFTDNNWQLLNRPGEDDISGTFIFTENPNRIRFTATAGWIGSWTYEYELQNDNSIISLTATGGSYPESSTGDFAE